MKILSKEEFQNELAEIVSYNITLNTENIKNVEDNDIFMIECLNLDSDSNDIILDIEDINTITKNKDLLIMSSFEQHGTCSAKESIKLILLDFEENNLFLMEADGILVYFQVNSNYNIMDFAEAMKVIYDRCKYKDMIKEPNTIFGVSCDNGLKSDYVKVTIFVGYSK